jgi:predicted Kef-type K+ transport protein
VAGPDSGSIVAIAGSLAKAIVKTAVAIVGIMAVGRIMLRPIYNRIAKLGKAELLTATTLFVALGRALNSSTSQLDLSRF